MKAIALVLILPACLTGVAYAAVPMGPNGVAVRTQVQAPLAPQVALECPSRSSMEPVSNFPAPWRGGTFLLVLNSASIYKAGGADLLSCNFTANYTVQTKVATGACHVAPGGKGFLCNKGTVFTAP